MRRLDFTLSSPANAYWARGLKFVPMLDGINVSVLLAASRYTKYTKIDMCFAGADLSLALSWEERELTECRHHLYNREL